MHDLANCSFSLGSLQWTLGNVIISTGWCKAKSSQSDVERNGRKTMCLPLAMSARMAHPLARTDGCGPSAGGCGDCMCERERESERARERERERERERDIHCCSVRS